jgi:tetratricopeptide (TPR) repeat protein
MKELRISLMALALVAFFSVALTAQCDTWNNSPKKDEAENAHVLYRGVVKGKTEKDLQALSAEEFNLAYDNWKTAYSIAPAADGQRATHYIDGRKILKALYNKETDAAKKQELANKIISLYDEQIQCYEKEAFLLGRKGFDMFYMPEFGYRQATFETLKQALEKGGNDTEYIVLEPLAQVLVYFYTSKKVSQEETQQLYEKMEKIAEHNIDNNETYGQYYSDTQKRMATHFKKIEDEVFDCEYFKKKLVPQYKENPEDLNVIQYTYVKLKTQGCDTTEVIMVELKEKYEVIAKAINDSLEVDRRMKNPGYDATQLQKEGKYSEAIARYQEAIAVEEDASAKAQYYYSVAFIQVWQFGQYSTAVGNARKAASLKSGWGKPYILIGDAYAKSSRNCGDDWGSRLAVLAAIDKYSYAKSIDSDVASDASKRISNYAGALPEKQEGFMRGVKEGQKAKVPCWIGETVTVRFRS